MVAGYLTNAALVGITEVAYVRWLDGRKYFVVDVVTQIVATVLGGYFCCRIAQQAKRVAATSLMALGLMIGTISFVSSWNTEPHWYGIVLLAVYAPCVWIGYAMLLWRNKFIATRQHGALGLERGDDAA